jgi:tetratricopeptide (TPR) repeat protein
VNRAYCHQLAGNWTNSTADLTAALASKPTAELRLQLLRDRAYAYFKADEPELAWIDYGDIVKLDTVVLQVASATPDRPRLLEDRGIAFIRLCQPEKALADFKAAQDLDRDNTFLPRIVKSVSDALNTKDPGSPPFFVYMWPYHDGRDIPNVIAKSLEPVS